MCPNAWERVPSDRRLDFRVFAEPLLTLAEATALKIEREWPAAHERVPGAQLLFRLLTRLATTTYQSIIYLSAEHPADLARRVAFSSSVPPMSRSIVDILYSVVFILEDIGPRTDWYYRAGWREMSETFLRYRGRYAGQPDWSAWLRDFESGLERIRRDWRVSDADAGNLRAIPRWPIPTKMKEHALTLDAKTYFQYLEDWFYREFSQEAHVTLPGLARRASTFLRDDDDDAALGEWKKKRSDWVGYAMVLELAVLSEIVFFFGFDLAARCSYLWGILTGYMEMARELHEVRYTGFLPRH
jgi:hypothetical protein